MLYTNSFGPNVVKNPLTDSVYTITTNEGNMPPPVAENFLLLNGDDFLLLNGDNLELLGH